VKHPVCLWHILSICSFHSVYWFWFPPFHFVVTGVEHLTHTSAVFYPVPLISFLVFLNSDIVNEIPTRHIIIKIYFHLLYIFTCISPFFSSSKNSISRCFNSFKCLIHFQRKKSNIKYCPVIRNINKQKLYFVLWTWLTWRVKWVVTSHSNLIWFSSDKWLTLPRQEYWGCFLVVKWLKLGAELRVTNAELRNTGISYGVPQYVTLVGTTLYSFTMHKPSLPGGLHLVRISWICPADRF
jgi:hypothetical protein